MKNKQRVLSIYEFQKLNKQRYFRPDYRRHLDLSFLHSGGQKSRIDLMCFARLMMRATKKIFGVWYEILCLQIYILQNLLFVFAL